MSRRTALLAVVWLLVLAIGVLQLPRCFKPTAAALAAAQEQRAAQAEAP